MNIRGYLQTSLNEWPGKVAAVVWSAGCNFRCPFCQNRDLVLNSQKLLKYDEKKILTDLKQRKGWLDALVVSGGEPTLQPDLINFLGKVKKIGLLTMIETNGSQPEILEELFHKKLLDRLSMDIKGPFDGYPQIIQTQVPSSLIKKSLKLMIAFGVDFELRTTVVPGLHNKETMTVLAKQLQELMLNHKPDAIRQFNWFLQQFVPQNCLDPGFEKVKPYGEKEMKAILKAVRMIIPQTELRGT